MPGSIIMFSRPSKRPTGSGDHYLRREDSVGQVLGQISLVSQSLQANISCLMELEHTDDISSQTIDDLLQQSHLDVE